ncbi:MAG: NAD-binding protein [Deltaproteobacteria bacterium]|nr:NAD-binding protein [Deltaproteobacteria bacterium]
MMQWNRRRHRVRAQLLLRQNRAAIAVVLLWFVTNYWIFTAILRRPWHQALWVLAYFEHDTSRWGLFYETMSDFVVFGMVMSVVATGISRHYRPEQTGAILAKSLRKHVVVVGYSNLGHRVVELCHKHGVDVVVVDPNLERVQPIAHQEHPLVLADGTTTEALEAASVEHAAVVILAEDGVEHGAIAARRVRALNDKCLLVVRCSDDDVGAVLARAYHARHVSTARLAARHVEQYAQKFSVRRCVIFGDNSLTVRVAQRLLSKGVTVRIVGIPHAKQLAHDGEPLAEECFVPGDPAAPDTHRRAGVPQADLVVLTGEGFGQSLVLCERIRDVNTTARVIVRVFHEDAAGILTQKPFRAEVVSSSRHALRSLVQEGIFESVGISREITD